MTCEKTPTLNGYEDERELGLKLTLLVGRWLKWWGSSSRILIKHICLRSVIQLRPSGYHVQLLGDRH